MSFPIPSFAPFFCSSAKVVHQPLKVERSGGKPFRSESSSCGEYSARKPFPVDKDKQTAYKRVLTLITHLYAVLVSIHRGTIILQQMNIGQAVNFTPSKNIEGIYPLLLSRCLPLYSRFKACSISLRLYKTLPPRT